MKLDLYQKAFIEALSIRSPKKVETTSHTYEISSFVDFACPNCREIITKKIELVNTWLAEKSVEMKCCYNCGQKLDWKE